MTQDEIRAIALEVARMDELMGPKDTFAFTKDRLVDFATRFLAAIAEKAEPVAWLVRDQVDGLRYPCNQKNPAGSIDGESEPLFTHPAIEPAQQAAFDQEIKDSDELLRLLNLPPDRYRTDGGCINLPKVRAAVREPWDYPTIDTVNPPVQSSVGAAPLPDAQLCRFYDVNNFPDLIAAMDHHIEKLQSKLPPTPSLWPGRVREG